MDSRLLRPRGPVGVIPDPRKWEGVVEFRGESLRRRLPKTESPKAVVVDENLSLRA